MTQLFMPSFFTYKVLVAINVDHQVWVKNPQGQQAEIHFRDFFYVNRIFDKKKFTCSDCMHADFLDAQMIHGIILDDGGDATAEM